jgi:NADH-quinone oxidoreductase subunit C
VKTFSSERVVEVVRAQFEASPAGQLATSPLAKSAVKLLKIGLNRGAAEVVISAEGMLDFFEFCRRDSELQFDALLHVTAVDWLDARKERFELVYQLLGVESGARLQVKITVPEDEAEVDSLTGVWRSANFMEREVWDMFGIRFRNHPKLQRVLMYEEFVGHPLRKDYPVQGKQPRIQLRYPEVENTARMMHRPELLQIRKRPSAD